MKSIIHELYETHDLTQEKLVYLLSNINLELENQLFKLADLTRRKYYKKKVYIRGLIEFSSYCINTCQYCGLRRENTKLERYRMTKEQIVLSCRLGYNLGIKTFVLQSGEDSFFTDLVLTDIIAEIKKRFPDVAVTLSIGERKKESYKQLFDAGADRYLLRHETVNGHLYQKLHPGMSLKNRLNCLNNLIDIGYQTGSGFIVGLPGQTNHILAQELVYLKKLNPQMIGIGPFIPHNATPLANAKRGSVKKTRICIALARLLVPAALMPVTTALAVANPNKGWALGLKAGANVIMPNLTPPIYSKGYQIYEGKSEMHDNAEKDLKQIESHITKAGYLMDLERGDHFLWR